MNHSTSAADHADNLGIGVDANVAFPVSLFLIRFDSISQRFNKVFSNESKVSVQVVVERGILVVNEIGSQERIRISDVTFLRINGNLSKVARWWVLVGFNGAFFAFSMAVAS